MADFPDILPPFLIFLGDVPDALAAKTGQGIVDWRRERVAGQMRLTGCGADLGVPELGIGEACRLGAKTFVIGAVNPGGTLPDAWVASIVAALEAGMDVASGMHARLGAVEAIATAAASTGRRLHDVRHSTRTFPTGNGKRRSGRRVLTVGTDCSIGKKYTALAVERELHRRDVAAHFRATGQTGILIAGSGVAIDAVVADFISGAVETLTPNNHPEHWDVIEGQGSLFHPSFAGVSLALLHGAQPDAFIVCHEPTRRTMRNVATPIADVDDVIEATIRHGRLTNPGIRCVGLAIDTSRLADDEAERILAEHAARFHLPVCDPIRTGVAPLVDELLAP
ncbi:MAG: DUF1611 domain-containing protein [Gammaproteobacteria bacterium]|nr:DUF1611 domain-containing protein [Gammaproteobacteria bacterium]